VQPMFKAAIAAVFVINTPTDCGGIRFRDLKHYSYH